MSISLRAVRPEDRGFLLRLYTESRREELSVVPWPEDAKAAFLADQFRLQDEHYRTRYDNAELLVIEREGRAVGRFYVHRSPGEIRLMDIIVDECERRQGIATQLFDDLMRESGETGVPIGLHVEPHNPAKRMYERFGFRFVESRGAYDYLRFEPG